MIKGPKMGVVHQSPLAGATRITVCLYQQYSLKYQEVIFSNNESAKAKLPPIW